MQKIRFHILLFFLALCLATSILFWQVFLKNQIPFSANLLASFFNPWAMEKFPGWEVGIPNKPTGKDDLWIFYPQRTFTNNLLKTGELPFWNPYSFLGNYHLGLSETAVFYPFNFLFLLFSQINVWVFLIVIQPIIAGIGMFLFLRRISINKKSAVLGAFAFAFCGVVLVRSVEGLSVGHTLIWMPYVFFGIESFFQTKKVRFLYAVVTPLVFSLLAGWFQYTFYIYIYSFVYSCFKIYFDSKPKTKMSFLIFVPFLLFPMLTFFHTIPALQALLDSPRSDLTGRVFSSQHLVPLSHVFTLIFPDSWGNPAVYNYIGKGDYKDSILFIGVIPFVFSLFSLFVKKNKKIIFFLISIGVTFLLAIDSVFSRTIISSNIPIFSSFLPNRIFLITTFSFCVLASYGFDFLIEEKKETIWKAFKKSFVLLWIIIFVLCFFIALRVLKDLSLFTKLEGGINRNIEVIQLRNSIIPLFFLFITTALFFIFKNKYSKNTFFFFVILLLFLQSFFFAQKYIPFSYRQFVYPNHPVFSYLQKHQGLDRFMSIGYGHIVPSIPLQFDLYSPEGIGSMYIKRYGEFVSYMKLGEVRIPDKIAFDQEIYPQDVFAAKNDRLWRFYQLANVKYIVVDKKSLEQSRVIPNKEDFFKVWENNTWLIYEYRKSMPRFFVTSSFRLVGDDKKILTSLFDTNFVPTAVFLEQYPGFESSKNKGTVEVIKYSPNEIVANVSSSSESLFYISDTYSKMFRVFIDGKEGKILRANYTFRAVPVPKGEHLLEMKYDDRSVILGFKTAFFTLLLLGLITYSFRKYI